HTVSGTAQDNVQVSAAASAGDASRASVGGAVAVTSFTNEARASLAGGAVVNVTGALNVTADATVPNQVPSFNPTVDLTRNDTATGTDRIAEQYADGGAIAGRVASALAPLAAYLNPVLGDPAQVGTSFVDARGTV